MRMGTYLVYRLSGCDGWVSPEVFEACVLGYCKIMDRAPLYYKWPMCSVRSLSTGACPWQRRAAPKADDGTRKLRFKKYHNGCIIGHHPHRHPQSYSIAVARTSQYTAINREHH